MIIVTIKQIQHNTKLTTIEMEEWEHYLRYLQTPSILQLEDTSEHAKTHGHRTAATKRTSLLKLKLKLILKLMLPIRFGYGYSRSRSSFLVVGYNFV